VAVGAVKSAPTTNHIDKCLKEINHDSNLSDPEIEIAPSFPISESKICEK